MATILITGTSGFIGNALAKSLASRHNIVCISRENTKVENVTTIQGDFTLKKDLQKLDAHKIGLVVHLAAATGNQSEEECLRINVQGTYQLLRHLINRGCQKFVLASSIASIGFQSTKFRPLHLPIPDEHPCLDRHGYGLSKYLMEEITRYFSLQNENLDFINIRLASILPESSQAIPVETSPIPGQWALGSLSVMYLSDAIRCFTIAAETPLKPGVRIFNAVGAQANVVDPVPKILRVWYGEDANQLDFSHYERSGHERDPIYDISKIKKELGFVPKRNVLKK